MLKSRAAGLVVSKGKTMADITALLCEQFKLKSTHVDNVIKLIDEGNTIPFIARYRKEMTGSMDDQLLRDVGDRLGYLRSLDARRGEVLESIAAQEKLTDELAQKINAAVTLAEVEDLYRPYRPKRRTRASIARERGLEALSAQLREQSPQTDPEKAAAEYIDAEKGVADAQQALAGAHDIIAEDVADDAAIRKQLRALCRKSAQIKSAALKEEDSVYRNYYEYEEPLAKVQSHRVLALNRGEREGFLKVKPKTSSVTQKCAVTLSK